MPTVPASAPSPAQQSGPPEGMLALAAGSMREAELKSRTPSLRERITGFISEKLGDDRDSYRRAQRITDALDLTPVGLATMAYDAGRMSDSPAGAAVGAGTLGLAIFAGPAARTANILKLEKALQMERAGAGTHDIWHKTGWNRGSDRMWKFEIADEGSKLTPLGEIGISRTPLNKYLDHPELFKAYPDMVGTRVGDRAIEGAGLGLYHADRDVIDLARGAMSSEKKRSVLLHETQHAVQNRERFAFGGVGKNEYNEWFGKIVAQAKKLRNAGKHTEADEADRLIQAAEGKKDDVTREVYHRLSGEVEARNVQTRADWPDWMREATPPTYSEDVHRFKQISRKIKTGG